MPDIFKRAIRWGTQKAQGSATYDMYHPYAGYSTYQGSIDIVNPLGETYVCASFVWYMLTAGGFDIGDAVAAVGDTLDRFLCRQLATHGWGWYPWTNRDAVQRGDVLIRLNNDPMHIVGHTELALSNFEMIGAHNHYETHPQDDISIVPLSSNWDGFFRYRGTPPAQPVPPWLLRAALKKSKGGFTDEYPFGL